MRFTIVNDSNLMVVIYPPQGVNEQPLEFDINAYRHVYSDDKCDLLFSVINGYLDTLPVESLHAIWNTYVVVKELVLYPPTLDALETKLTNAIKVIFQHINYEQLHYFVEVRSGVLVPSDIKASHGEVDESFSREKTYIRSEYIDLVVFSVAIRILIPIWGEFIQVIKDTVAPSNREYRAYLLMRRSILINNTAYRRLMVYVSESITATHKTPVATIAGIGREEFPEWLCGYLIVRKLGWVDVTAGANRSNVINAVFSFIDYNLKQLSKKFAEIVHEKQNNASSNMDGEREPSYLETFRVKQAIPYGNIVLYNVFLEDIQNTCRCVDPTIDPRLVDEVIRVNTDLEREPFSPHNLIIAQWVLSTVIPSSSLEILEKLSASRGMIASQALLHHWGMHSLALLVTGIDIRNGRVSTFGDRMIKPTLEDMVVLDKLYPYGKPATTKAAKNKPNNPALTAISELCSILFRYPKAVRAPGFLTQADIPDVNRHGHMTTPADTARQLITLLVKINSLPMEKIQ